MIEHRWAVVPAAGHGSRFGGALPKQYTPLLGLPMLSWTLQSLLDDATLTGIMVAVAADDPHWRRLPESAVDRVQSCSGGSRRDLSVCNALQALADRAHDTDWVLVHDAARPCLRQADLDRLFAELAGDPVGGLLAVPVNDTLKQAGATQRVEKTVSRNELWRALTPQMFRYGLLHRALCLCIERDRAVTDEAGAIEMLGLEPRLVRGHADNIKVTDVEDAALAAAILASRL
jgi:2-C-methyl-D-erythritol 4-phosphate cytidylyltransferase